MTQLSTPGRAPTPPSQAGDRSDRRRRRPADLFLFFVVPLAVGVVFVAVLLAERADVAGDLQIVAPPAARPGSTLAVRAFHFRALDRPEGPELVDAPGRVWLAGPDGRSLAEAPLESSASLGLEAVLSVPSDARGTLTLRAEAPLDHERVSEVVAPLRIDPDARPSTPRGRLALALQRYSLSPVEPEPGADPPSHLVPRVIGGACVPEVRCDLLVLVGEPAARVSVEPSAMVTPAGEPPGERAGLVHLPIVTHGPEAEIVLVARRGGSVVARRTVRLPIVLASFAARLGDGSPAAGSLATAPASPALAFDGVEEGRAVIVDGFRDGLWERTGSIPADAPEPRLPFEPLGPGLWRLQARTDPFASDSAAVRMLHVREEGESEDAALAALVGQAATWDDPLASAVRDLDGDPAARAAFLLALPEMDVVPLPLAMSSQMQASSGLTERRVRLRWLAAAAVLLAGLFVMVMVLRRGLAAGVQARAILRDAGDEEADTPRARRRMTLSVIAAVLALALAFVAAAALVLTRGGL